jgi:SAM-dependent methyltransferase
LSERSPDEILWNLLRGSLTTRALAVVSELGVADVLAGGSRSVEELGRELGADPETLYRLLRALASDGVFAEEEPRVFRNTDASEPLCAGRGWNEFAHLFGGPIHRAVTVLDASGRSPFEETFGTDFWSWLKTHPDERANFDRAMEQGKEGRIDRLEPVAWRGDETVVDVGGGNGSLLVELLRLHSGLRGVVFDLPEAVRDEAALGDRIDFVEGSFFESVPEGDVYILSTILHDWNDEQAAAILRTIRAAAPDGSRLLILDAVVPPGNEPSNRKWLDLVMLTLVGGKERTEAQWRELLVAGHFEPVRFHEALIEAVPCR